MGKEALLPSGQDNFHERRSQILATLKNGDWVDFHKLSFTGKHVVGQKGKIGTLVHQHIADIEIVENRARVVPSLWLRHQFLNKVVGVATAGMSGVINAEE